MNVTHIQKSVKSRSGTEKTKRLPIKTALSKPLRLLEKKLDSNLFQRKEYRPAPIAAGIFLSAIQVSSESVQRSSRRIQLFPHHMRVCSASDTAPARRERRKRRLSWKFQ